MLTVLIATHNGALTLPKVLESFCALREPDGGWRLVIVDNASSDGTVNVVNEFINRLPLTLIQTSRRGKNVALNIGLREIDGDLVVLTDDDVIPDPDWLVVLRNTADKQRDFDIFGGAIYPVWPRAPDEWINKQVNLGATYAITPSNISEGPISATSIWGANMAVRSTVFIRGHRFNEDVGPQAGQYIMGSEVEFGSRIEKEGHRGWFVPMARVGHIIRDAQMEKEWVIRRQYRLGRHMFYQEVDDYDSNIKLIAGAPRWKYRQLVAASLRSIWCYMLCNAERKLSADLEKSYLLGYLAEARNYIRKPV